MYCHECGQAFQKPVNFCSNCGIKLSPNTPTSCKPLLTKAISNNKLPELITVKELERFLNISTQKAYELVHSKGFPTIKVGRSYRVNKDSLLRMIDDGRVF